MYPQYGRESSFIIINGVLVGVAMGSDSTSEHEWGVAPLQAAFGLASAPPKHARYFHKSETDYERWLKAKNEPTFIGAARRLFRRDPPLPSMGIAKRNVTVVPALFQWVEKDGAAGFVYYKDKNNEHVVNTFLGHFVRDRDLVCGWSDQSFVVLAKSEESIARLKVIFEAVQNKDAALGSFGLGRGLTIAITSRVPTEVKEALLKDDMEKFEMDRRVGETGIIEEVRAAKKGFYSLSQGMVNDAGVLRIWLNPQEQHLYNYGWYTVEELRQWTKNEGPIMKRKAA